VTLIRMLLLVLVAVGPAAAIPRALDVFVADWDDR
jgi:hypothetical protein